MKFKAPGRINLIGEHTDYNDGYVFPAAINRYIEIDLEPNDSGMIELTAADYKESYSFPVSSHYQPSNTVWVNYFLGILEQVPHEPIHGFTLTFRGDIPIGSGLSSSAALESAFITALSHTYSFHFGKTAMVKMGQKAEHDFVGVQCGIMDQFASIMGKEGHAIQLDCRSLEYEYIPLTFSDHEIVLINSKVNHSLANSEYNKRRQECEDSVEVLSAYFGRGTHLRDFTLNELYEVKDSLTTEQFQRSSYVIAENGRVLRFTEALLNHDMITVGRLLFESHRGLSEQYKVSCDELDILVSLAKSHAAVLGARMMGGGFGGCTINVVEKVSADDVVLSLVDGYQKATGIDAEVYRLEVVDGAGG